MKTRILALATVLIALGATTAWLKPPHGAGLLPALQVALPGALSRRQRPQLSRRLTRLGERAVPPIAPSMRTQ